jgi:hypothetical protein
MIKANNETGHIRVFNDVDSETILLTSLRPGFGAIWGEECIINETIAHKGVNKTLNYIRLD